MKADNTTKLYKSIGVNDKERIMIILEIIGIAAIIELIITITAFVIVEKISWR